LRILGLIKQTQNVGMQEKQMNLNVGISTNWFNNKFCIQSYYGKRDSNLGATPKQMERMIDEQACL